MGFIKLIRMGVVVLAGYIAYQVVKSSVRDQKERQRSARKNRKVIKSKVVHDDSKKEQ